jgi:hypothetical protein
MRNPIITQLIIGTAAAVGMSVIAINAVAQSSVEPTQDVLTNCSTPFRKPNSGLAIISSLRAIFSTADPGESQPY